MRYVPAFIAVFLFCALTTDHVSAVPLVSPKNETNFSPLPNQPLFSVETDIFLGQKRGRGGGRVWANTYYGDTTLKPVEGGRIDPSLYGLQIGVDLVQAHCVYSTFFFNVNQSKVKFGNNFGGGSSIIDNYHLGYGKFVYLSMCHLALTGSIGYDRYEVTRMGTGTGDGLQSNFFGEFGLDFLFGQWALKPFYALQYDFLYHGKIGKSPVLYEDWNGHGLQQLFGLRVIWKPKEILELQSRVTWVHELLDNPPPFYHVRFSPLHGINTPAVLFHEGDTGRDWAWLGIGAKLDIAFDVYLFLDYDILLNERHTTHLGSLGLCLCW